MDSPYTKIYTDICDFNHMIEQVRVFVKDLKEIKEKEKSTIDVKLKECRLTLDRLTLDPINRFENVNEVINIMENLFDNVRRPRRLKNIDLLLVRVMKQYAKMFNEKMYAISLQIYPKV